MAKLRPDQLPDATAGTKFAHVVNKQNTTDGPDGTSERLELSNLVGAIDPNHVFNTTTERDAYFTSNPSELQTGIYCVVNTPFAYFRYNGTAWVEQTGVVTGPQGEKGDSGDFSGLTNNTIPKASGSDLSDSPLSVDAQGNVSMTGTFTADEIKTNISSVTLGDQKKISGVGEGVEIVDLSHNKHKFIVTQQLAKTGDNRPYSMEEGDYQLVPIVTDTTNDITDPEFEFTTSLGDQNLYGFKVVPNGTQTNVEAQICRQGETKPVWSEIYDSVGSDEFDIDPVILDGNQTYKFSITGSYKGDSSGKMAYSIGARLSQKRYLLDERDRVNVDGVQTPNIETGTGLSSEESGDSIVISTDGKEDVIEYNVDDDATVTLGKSETGKFISITQNSMVATPMIFTLEEHADFSLGDTIKIGASESYVNYYFGVFYSQADGRVRVVYPNNNCKLTCTANGWDVEQDGRFTKTAIRAKAKAGTPFVGDEPDGKPVQAFTFIDHPAVQYIEDGDGNRVIEIDLNKVSNNSNDTVDIVGWWTDNASPTADDVLNALGQTQTASLISHTDDVKADALPTTSIAMRREENSAKYTYFAYPAGFFTDKDGAPLEPTLVNTGVGNSADWVVSTVDVDGVLYRIQRSPAQNVSQQLLTCKLIQEGY